MAAGETVFDITGPGKVAQFTAGAQPGAPGRHLANGRGSDRSCERERRGTRSL